MKPIGILGAATFAGFLFTFAIGFPIAGARALLDLHMVLGIVGLPLTAFLTLVSWTMKPPPPLRNRVLTTLVTILVALQLIFGLTVLGEATELNRAIHRGAAVALLMAMAVTGFFTARRRKVSLKI